MVKVTNEESHIPAPRLYSQGRPSHPINPLSFANGNITINKANLPGKTDLGLPGKTDLGLLV